MKNETKLELIAVFTIIAMILSMIMIVVSIKLLTLNKNTCENSYDVNKDGVVNAVDYILIKNYIMEVAIMNKEDDYFEDGSFENYYEVLNVLKEGDDNE